MFRITALLVATMMAGREAQRRVLRTKNENEDRCLVVGLPAVHELIYIFQVFLGQRYLRSCRCEPVLCYFCGRIKKLALHRTAIVSSLFCMDTREHSVTAVAVCFGVQRILAGSVIQVTFALSKLFVAGGKLLCPLLMPMTFPHPLSLQDCGDS